MPQFHHNWLPLPPFNLELTRLFHFVYKYSARMLNKKKGLNWTWASQHHFKPNIKVEATWSEATFSAGPRFFPKPELNFLILVTFILGQMFEPFLVQFTRFTIEASALASFEKEVLLPPFWLSWLRTLKSSLVGCSTNWTVVVSLPKSN